MSFLTSQSTEKLDAALAKAQGKIKLAKKNAVNPHFQKPYADLGSVWEACREALAEAGISVSQWPIIGTPNKITLLTRIAHAGEWMQSTYEMPIGKTDAHGTVGAITYAKRAALSAAVGVASEGEDDDGNDASGRPAASSQGKPPSKPAGSPPPAARQGNAKPPTTGKPPEGNPNSKDYVVTEKQLKRMFTIAEERGFPENDIRAFIKKIGLKSTKELKKTQYDNLVFLMENYKPKAKDEFPDSAEPSDEELRGEAFREEHAEA